MTLADLDTPALLIDLDIMERNLARVASYARAHHLRLRPHTKTHKIPALGRQQLALGAVGLTVAKVSEAEVMLDSGAADLLVAYPTYGSAKLARLIDVARQTKVTMALDSLEIARPLSAAAHAAGVSIGVLAEFDAGMGRVGVDVGQPLLELVQGIEKLPGLTFEGLAFYPGQIKMMDDEGRAELAKVSQRVGAALDLLGRHSIACPIVSAGSTPTCVPRIATLRPPVSIAVTRYGTLSPMSSVRGSTLTVSERSGVRRITIRRRVVSRPIIASKSVLPARVGVTRALPTLTAAIVAILGSATLNRGATSGSRRPAVVSTSTAT